MKPDVYALLDDYLDGLLADDEKARLEQRLTDDAELKAELALLRQTRAFGIYRTQHGAEEEEALARTLEGLGKQYFSGAPAASEPAKQAPRKVWRRLLPFMTAAAAVALLVFIVPRFFIRGNLFEEYANYPNAGFTLKSAATNDAQLLADAEERFNRKDYPGAADALRNFLNAHPNEPEQMFYLGLCLLEQDHAGEAIDIFRELGNGKTTYASDGNWYLALAFLKKEDWDSAAKTLERIPEQDPYFRKANELLSKIRKRQH